MLKWYQGQLADLGVDIKLGVGVSEALLRKEKPDTVIIATGSVPVIPGIPGIDKKNVVTCTDLLLGKKKAGKNAVVIGGGLVEL